MNRKKAIARIEELRAQESELGLTDETDSALDLYELSEAELVEVGTRLRQRVDAMVAAQRATRIRHIRAAWANERRETQWLNPRDELELDLEVLSNEQLGTLRDIILARTTDHTPVARFYPLPEGWYWCACWQAWHHEHGKTSIYGLPEHAVAEAKRRMPPIERARAVAVRDGDMFANMEDLF